MPVLGSVNALHLLMTSGAILLAWASADPELRKGWEEEKVFSRSHSFSNFSLPLLLSFHTPFHFLP